MRTIGVAGERTSRVGAAISPAIIPGAGLARRRRIILDELPPDGYSWVETVVGLQSRWKPLTRRTRPIFLQCMSGGWGLLQAAQLETES
jgi:hypothetical protein